MADINRGRRNQLKATRPTSFSSSPIVQAQEPAINTLPKRGTDLTPRRRLRHDDSQIQFIAVESSPSFQSEPESQLLTRRQREVKERQRETSMLLNGLRSSSPALPSPAKDAEVRTPVQLPNLRNSGPTSEIPLTPTLAGALQENDDEFPGSSPTPGTNDRTPLDKSKIPSSLSIQALETCESDPPSSPPELRRNLRSRGKVTRQVSPHREVESVAPLNNNSNAGKDDCADQPDDSSVSPAVLEGNGPDRTPAGDPGTDRSSDQAPPTSNGLKEAPNMAAEGPQSTDSVPADMVPDSFSDDLEQQVASQIEQDLELAADLDEVRETRSQPEPPYSFPMTRKRKREAEAAELSSTPDRGKRRSLRRSSAAAKEVAKEVVKETPKNLKNVGTASERRQPASGADRISTPSSKSKPKEKRLETCHEVSTPSSKNKQKEKSNIEAGDEVWTPSSSKSKQKEKSNLESGYALRSGPERKSSHSNDDTNTTDAVLSPANSENPPQKKRRSLRLSGVPASPVPEPEPVSRPSRVLRSHTKATDSVQDAAGSSEEPPLGKTPDRPPSEKALLDRNPGPDVQAPEETETGEPVAGSEPATVTEAPDDDNMRTELEEPGENGVDTDVAMNGTDGRAPQEASDDSVMRSYVSAAVQTNETVDKDEITGEAIIKSLRQVLSNIKKVNLARSVLREVDDVMFDIRVEAHEAARRYGGD